MFNRIALGSLLLLSGSLSVQSQQASSNEHVGTLRTLVIDYADPAKLPTHQYYFEDAITQERHKMQVSPTQFEEGVTSGSIVTVTGNFVNGELHADAVHLHSTNEKKREGMHGLASTYPSNGIKLALVVPDFSKCNPSWVPSGNVSQYQNMFFERSNPNGYTTGMQLRACSHGSYLIDYDNSAVLNFTVPATSCTGASAGSYNSSGGCPTNWGGFTNDLNALATAAGYNWNAFTNHWMFFPGAWGCGFAGLGYVGADGLWIPDNYFSTMQVTLHEFGHNMGMNHAAIYNNGSASEYGDRTGMMGNSKDVCYNAANRETAGWQNVSTVNASAFDDGYWTNVNLLAVDKYPAEGLKIVTALQRDGTTNGKSNVSYYLEFRRVSKWMDLKVGSLVPSGGDSDFDSSLTGVLFHFYPNPWAGANALGGAWWTTLEKSLSLKKGNVYSDWNRTGLHFRIRANNTYNNQSDVALVEICRCAVGLNYTTCCGYHPAAVLPSVSKPMATSTLGGLVGASCGAVAIGAGVAVLVVKKKRGTLSFGGKNKSSAAPVTATL
eukprot:TRINITY_DN576_c0_g1_i1.p1 TRINITY_DN576_c0_g1~~TRINITY_DN576_c0_g1_i1.p1  ORF type:complete len:550 (-),score=104.53 TRINITY_DN576_c0_g1_i1:45-1694(-)